MSDGSSKLWQWKWRAVKWRIQDRTMLKEAKMRGEDPQKTKHEILLSHCPFTPSLPWHSLVEWGAPFLATVQF